MNTQTGKDLENGIKSSNYSVAAVSRRVFDRSNISAIFVNKTVLDHNENDHEQAYSSVAGIEYNLLSKDNKMAGKSILSWAFLHLPTIENLPMERLSITSPTKWYLNGSHEWLGHGFESDAGFIPRNNFLHINPTIGWNVFPRYRTYPDLVLATIVIQNYGSPIYKQVHFSWLGFAINSECCFSWIKLHVFYLMTLILVWQWCPPVLEKVQNILCYNLYSQYRIWFS